MGRPSMNLKDSPSSQCWASAPQYS